MKRDKMIEKMIQKAQEITGKNTRNFTWEKHNAIWDMCSDWNSQHATNEEIFMGEMEADKEHPGGGFYIEDDYFIFED